MIRWYFWQTTKMAMQEKSFIIMNIKILKASEFVLSPTHCVKVVDWALFWGYNYSLSQSLVEFYSYPDDFVLMMVLIELFMFITVLVS